MKKAGIFSALMDKTTDCSHKEQVAIFVRYLHETKTNCIVEERLLGLVSTTDTTGAALTELLISCLHNNTLNMNDVVGQGYDGGCNMRGASKGVQARIKELNKNAIFTHCYIHNLNRALVNALFNTSHSDMRNFFGTIELIFTFIEGSAARHAYFLSQQRENDPNEVALRLAGLSDTRWNCRASSLRRLSQQRVLKAVINTIEHTCK